MRQPPRTVAFGPLALGLLVALSAVQFGQPGRSIALSDELRLCASRRIPGNRIALLEYGAKWDALGARYSGDDVFCACNSGPASRNWMVQNSAAKSCPITYTGVSVSSIGEFGVCSAPIMSNNASAPPIRCSFADLLLVQAMITFRPSLRR